MPYLKTKLGVFKLLLNYISLTYYIREEKKVKYEYSFLNKVKDMFALFTISFLTGSLVVLAQGINYNVYLYNKNLKKLVQLSLKLFFKEKLFKINLTKSLYLF